MAPRHGIVNSGASETLCLALCSATRTASVALLERGEVVVEHSAVADRHQSESLLPLVDRVLADGGVAIEALGCIGLSIGPGSFTSLRIGVATVKGLVYGTDVQVVGVSTLQALAEAAEIDGASLPKAAAIIGMLNAQRGEVYAAAFAGDNADYAARGSVLPELVYDATELSTQLPKGCVLVGDGVEVVSAAIREKRGDDLSFATGLALEPTAGSVGRLAVAEFAERGGADAAALAPRYVRRAEAEVTRTAERFER
jgi:tRNA threonylcarbamoyladenosine biosynthesis protein TsaB